MTVHSETVRTERQGSVGIIIVDNPPVNAIAPSVREGIASAADEFATDAAVAAVILHCAGTTFMAGADIKKLAAAPARFTSAQIIRRLEDMAKPVVAALQGNALGGGLEFALACHYRCAAPKTSMGLPEVNLGLIPGAGGTQRLPRLVGVETALDMIISGKPVNARRALEIGLVDKLLAGQDVLAEAVQYARELIEQRAPARRTRRLKMAPVSDEVFTKAAAEAARSRRGEQAPLQAITAIRAAVELAAQAMAQSAMPAPAPGVATPAATGDAAPSDAAADAAFDAGIERESQLFALCRDAAQSRAMRHLFMAERNVNKIPGIARTTPIRAIRTVGVVGAGTMGRGIAMAFANAGFDVLLSETDAAALDRAQSTIRETYAASVSKGRMSAADAQAHVDRIKGKLNLGELAPADLVIEAVFEDMALKKKLFGELSRICKADAILATNTSALDVDAIAAASSQPQSVIGLHFFSPANIMRLVEIVRARSTGDDVIATSMDLVKRLRKIGVLAGNCDGFIGNRMLAGYRREAEFLLLEGAAPEHVDEVLVRFGMAMGPNAMGDMAGLDVGAAGRKRRRAEGTMSLDPRFGAVADKLVELGRFGQKTGAGYYRYEKGGRRPLPDPQVQALIEHEAARLGVRRRAISDDEIIERCMLPLINEGARIIEAGIALRPGDIDVIWANGYGFPRYRGGPMCYADEIGLASVLAKIRQLRESHGPEFWEPAPLLVRLADDDASFASLNAAG